MQCNSLLELLVQYVLSIIEKRCLRYVRVEYRVDGRYSTVTVCVHSRYRVFLLKNNLFKRDSVHPRSIVLVPFHECSVFSYSYYSYFTLLLLYSYSWHFSRYIYST